jgi:hypothetical protein
MIDYWASIERNLPHAMFSTTMRMMIAHRRVAMLMNAAARDAVATERTATRSAFEVPWVIHHKPGRA